MTFPEARSMIWTAPLSPIFVLCPLLRQRATSKPHGTTAQGHALYSSRVWSSTEQAKPAERHAAEQDVASKYAPRLARAPAAAHLRPLRPLAHVRQAGPHTPSPSTRNHRTPAACKTPPPACRRGIPGESHKHTRTEPLAAAAQWRRFARGSRSKFWDAAEFVAHPARLDISGRPNRRGF